MSLLALMGVPGLRENEHGVKLENQEEDYRLILAVREQNLEALDQLMRKYKHFVRMKSRSYYMTGGDKEDIIQEGMIGLYKAIRDYNLDKQTTFKSFADLCITRQIITAIKSSMRQKHIPLNSYISLDRPMFDDDSDFALIDILPEEKAKTPEQMLIYQEESEWIELKIEEELSTLEKDALALYLDGKTYQQISLMLNRHVKSIDNALQRVKKKLEKTVGQKEMQVC